MLSCRKLNGFKSNENHDVNSDRIATVYTSSARTSRGGSFKEKEL